LARYFPVYKLRLGLPDFSPVSQDLIAIAQIKERKSFTLIQEGELASAMALCAATWASLPGSPYGQHTNQFEALLTVYLAHGGQLAITTPTPTKKV
jgi:muramidase (phage lysozyme)